MKADLSEAEMDAWQALLHAHHKITTVLDAELRSAHQLTWAEYDVLLRLAKAASRTLTMTELARRIMISPSGLTRVVDGLEDRGLVKRSRSADDARVVSASLTDQGREKVRRAAQTHLRGIREHFTGRLSAAQLREVAAALQVITGPHIPH
ncbi:MAG TPA: MarR family transcriptional regulator [Gemmatimonadaceae bacterium]|nr:MarR family transcriptional regulator [Gemmatimonadaceae bacterium]